jgi:hypothetical protein
MEFSDLLIALARAQGIPARAAYGYGYDLKLAADKQENHQWVQVWLPDYGWLTIDPTWGQSGREFIGRDLDHALWYVASIDPDTPSPVEAVSANEGIEILDSQIEITAIEEIPEGVELKTYSDLQNEIQDSKNPVSGITRTVQTTAIGRSMLVVVPTCLGVVIMVLVVSVFIRFLGRRKTAKPKIHQISQNKL